MRARPRRGLPEVRRPAGRPGSTRAARAGSCCKHRPGRPGPSPGRPTARRRRGGLTSRRNQARRPRPASGGIDMEFLTQALFAVGTVVLAIAFAATVGPCRAARQRPATPRRRPRGARRRPAGLGRRRHGLVRRLARRGRRRRPRRLRRPEPAVARLALADDRRVRSCSSPRWSSAAVIVGRGPWGNLFEFSVAFATSILFGYLVLSRRYQIGSIAFIPVGVALGAGAVRVVAAARDQPARARAPEPAAAHDPRRAGGARRTGSSRRRSPRGSATSSRAARTGTRGCRRTASSMPSPIAR